MTTLFEAIFENGVLRPLKPLPLVDQQRVTITIDDPHMLRDTTHFDLPPEQWEVFCSALDAPPQVILPLRKLLSQPSVFDGPAPR